MGNQPSKGEKDDPGFQKYPSFSRSDTKESSRSLRSSIKSKIPGKVSSDSPRGSVADLPSGKDTAPVDSSDAVSIQSSTSTKNAHKRTSSVPSLANIDTEKSASRRSSVSGSEPPTPGLQPPPSPTLSSSLGHGHSEIAKARRSGEVDAVSDAPPSSALQPMNNLQEPRESILVRRDAPKPSAAAAILAMTAESGSPTREMDIGALTKSDLDDMIKRLIDAGYAGKVTKTVCLKNAEITAICLAAREVFLSQPALLELSPPVKIVGDVHGQYTDLIRMFEMCGFPPNSNYLFLGDYVDRGKQSLETILLLLCYKLRYPENFFLLRGNHECANVTRVYGFYDECKRRCNVKIWKSFVDTFNTLPIASIVAGKIFCVHGGLSPSLTHMDDIRNIARPTDVPDYGLLNDLLWSDPADMEADWEANERGVSYCFSKQVIMQFLQKHDFDLVCRAHMVVEDGYEFFTDRILVTVFSAPNVSHMSSPY